ncbi:AAA family ATPase [Nitriliruptoraceae bacterium ZYF776]|nr:AAA family ATPase [Profundirhabdus halotolerans]
MTVTSATDLEPLRLDGPLPAGVHVLEASAGTGKTYTIAALVTRAVAEGVCELPRILVVTFTRAATAELRDRVRRRLVEAQDHLAAVLAADATRATGDDAVPTGDPVLAHLAAAPIDELRARRDRLVRAVREFDAATISTIHGFTQQVLRSVGLSVEIPRQLTLLEDTTELIAEVSSDVAVRRLSVPTASGATPVGATELRTIATQVLSHPDARLVPDAGDPDPRAAQLGALAAELRTDAAAVKRRRAVLGYDDLLVALREALRDPAQGDRAAGVLRERYHWVLVDEFQDTDPTQWDILARAFGGARAQAEGRALVLIGDPKQAIYAFRGADVATYLRATRSADRRLTLGTNHRSDPALLRALEVVLGGAHFGHDDIVFRSVGSPAGRADQRIAAADGGPRPAALELRVVGATPDGPRAGPVRDHTATDVAAEVVRHLREVTLDRPDGPVPLRPRQLAVLVRTNAEASQVQRALRELDVPSVVNGVGNVLATDAAGAWSHLLDAVERPADPVRARRLAASPWCGWDAARLADPDERELDDLHDRLHRWAAVLRDHGVATLERVVTTESGVDERLLAEVGGERLLTDLRHVGQLLHAAELHDERGVTGLRSWLAERRADAAAGGVPAEEDARRLESDDEAVQILTVHRSKGLEFEVCLVPFLWSPGAPLRAPYLVDDPTGSGRLLDLGPSDRPGHDDAKAQAQREQAGEALRLAYVALTRAKHRAVVWWAEVGRQSDRSALARLLFRPAGAPVDLAGRAEVPDGQVATCAVLRDRFADVAADVVPVPETLTPTPWEGHVGGDTRPLAARRWTRHLDRSWSRTSYSAILRRAEGAATVAATGPVASEVEPTTREDEPDGVEPVAFAAPPADPALAAPVPLGEIRGGTAFGTLVHAVLEHVDLAAADLPAALTRVLDEQVRRHDVAVDPEVLVPGLVAAIHSPLGPLAGEVADADGRTRWRRLADLERRDRLDELTFELPLAGGDAGRRDGPAVTVHQLAALLDRAPADGGLATDDPFRVVGYADTLRDRRFALDLRGYLTGAIDLTLRIDGPDGQPRYLVADHKTNRLAWPEAPTPWDHRREALVEAMVHHHYPLQALLYQVALHRYLRWRQPGYDPAVHLGGALYLFLRGMVGPDTPSVDGHPVGVLGWQPPAALVVDASAVLAGEQVRP